MKMMSLALVLVLSQSALATEVVSSKCDFSIGDASGSVSISGAGDIRTSKATLSFDGVDNIEPLTGSGKRITFEASGIRFEVYPCFNNGEAYKMGILAWQGAQVLPVENVRCSGTAPEVRTSIGFCK